MLAVIAAAAPAQTTQKVVDQYLRASGGARALAQIQTETIAGSLTDESGRSGSFSLIAKAPNRFYLEIIAGAERQVEAYNGMSAWGQDAEHGVHTLTGAAAREAEAEGRYRNSRLADLKKAKLNVVLLGVEKVGGRDADHLQVLLAPGLAREIFVDRASHLIVRETAPGEQMDYDDYRPVDGIPAASRIELRRGGHVYRVEVTRTQFNSAVDDPVFDFPRASAAPLPDIKTLIIEVSRNQKAVEEMQKQYTCHVTSEEDKVDSKGRTVSRGVKEYEVFYIGGDEVRHKVAEDGKPLAGDAKKKEDDRFNKEYAKMEEQAAKKAADPKKQQKEDEQQETQISDVLRAVRFSNARRERFRGQEVIAVDFGPDPGYKPRNLMENVAHKMSGVLWIDEQARDVARMEAHFTASFKIAGGVLASIEQGTSFVVEQAKVNDEVWLPIYSEVHAGGRVLFLRMKANEIERYSDYRKFHTDSKITIVQP